MKISLQEAPLQAEEKKSANFEDRSVEIIQSEEQKEKRMNCKQGLKNL